MYKLLGFFTQNTMKTLYVLEEIGVNYEYQFVDLGKGEQREEWFLRMNPVGKAPVLQHGERSLFESGAICRYVANVENSSLYPEDKYERALVDQWLDFFTCHLGRWLNTLFFENVIKKRSGLGEPDAKACAEALNWAPKQFAIIDEHFKNKDFFLGDQITIADLCAFAYIEQVNAYDVSLEPFPHVRAWYDRLAQRESVKKAKARLPQ